MRLSMNHRTRTVHTLADDCEIHMASAAAEQLAWPAAVVVEPPNVCKERAPGMPQSSEKRLREELWPKYLDTHVMTKECEVTGFPRIFTEHASGNQDPANPNHVLEVHPALGIDCGAGHVLEMGSFLKAYPGMRKIKPETAQSCLQQRELFVRKNESRYEFVERGGQCGNFAVFHVTINPDWVRKISGGHSAIARVSPTGAGTFTLKLYTYDTTPEDKILADMRAGLQVTRRLYFHGMLTYDYFSIIKALRAPDRVTWLDQRDWTAVRFPLAFVVFGETSVEESEE
jgi:hypothetical protein